MSRLPFELLLAWRYLRPKRSFVSLVSLISVLGVTLGVAVLLVVIGVFTGFDQKLREKILGFTPHLEVFSSDQQVMLNFQPVARRVAANPLVKAVAPFVLGQVLISAQPHHGPATEAAPWVRGLDPAVEPQMSVLPFSMVQGRFDLSGHALVIGTELAKQLKVTVGDYVQLYAPADLLEWRRNFAGDTKVPPPALSYQIRGIFDAGYYDYNHSLAAASLENAQRMYNLGKGVHGLSVVLKNADGAAAVRQQLERALGPAFQVTTWMEANAELLGQVTVARNVQFYLLFFIMIVAALCILSALITFVIQKTQEIGLLKALGATDLQVAAVFLGQSGLIGAVGISAGVALGRLALLYRNDFLHFLNRALRMQLLAPSIYGFGDLPALVVPRDVLLICASALTICLLGGVIPACLAGRLQPIQALRHE